MNKEGVFQELLQLEICDVVMKWYTMIHDRDLPIRWATEVSAVVKQSSEYF